jgi:serine/threonine protein kinase
MTGAVPAFQGLERRELASRTREVLSRGGRGNPDVLLVESDLGPVVVKDFGARGGWVRRAWGPWLLRREALAFQRLADLESVPRLLGWLDEAALVFEYRPGTLLSRSLAGHLPPDFLPRLQDAIAEMHHRGVVHLDLRHRSNILADDEGRPVLIDFGSALRFDRATVWGRAGVAVLGRVDRGALRKWRVRLLA